LVFGAKAAWMPFQRIAHTGIWVESKLLAEIEYRAK